MAFKIPARLKRGTDGPALNPGQERRRDALQRVGTKEQDFEMVVARLGFPVGIDTYWFNDETQAPGMAKVVRRSDVDLWTSDLKRIAKGLK